jgi:cytochrome c biogenesis protein CcmG/thiol:disulfide interchange protein DsbE
VSERRFPLVPVVIATVVALAAAIGVLALLGGDDDGGSDQAGGNGDGEESPIELTPQGELPASAEEVVLADLEGGDDRELGELLGGRPVVLNFFASWCVPCLQEMPDFEAVHQDVGDEVTFVGLANRDDPEAALEMVDRTGVTYPTYGDPESGAITYFGGMVMPTTVFLDATGEVVDVRSEPLTEEALRQAITDLFGVQA